MNELTIKDGIKFTPATIEFSQFETLKAQATEISQFIKNIEVNEETVKESKKVLATSRKAIKAINDERIRIKKELLKPYDTFHDQIKEIESILDESNQIVNAQVREIEEIERAEKKENINGLWNKQMIAYKYSDLIEFENFYEERHSNKSLSMTKIETEMSEFLEKVEKDIDYLKSKNQSEYIAEYLEHFDLTETLSIVEQRKALMDKIDEVEVDEIIVDEEKAIFEVIGKANITLTEMLLKENEINYRKI